MVYKQPYKLAALVFASTLVGFLAGAVAALAARPWLMSLARLP